MMMVESLVWTCGGREVNHVIERAMPGRGFSNLLLNDETNQPTSCQSIPQYSVMSLVTI